MDIVIDVSGIKIETERVILRPFSTLDLNDLYAYAKTPGVGENAGWPHHKTMETSRKVLNNFIKNKNTLAIVYKADDKVVGSLGMHTNSWANRSWRYRKFILKEIGYVLSKDYWGRGIMPETVNAFIDYGFKELGIEAFFCSHFIHNNNSKRVIEKCGFTYVKKGKYYAGDLNRSFKELRYVKFPTLSQT
ncbi:MAG: GNAT family N-acetyltransferase [Turicibacter sp.]|nr:GNAT family N-acetyltransferase [Turicibacter sp.]